MSVIPTMTARSLLKSCVIARPIVSSARSRSSRIWALRGCFDRIAAMGDGSDATTENRTPFAGSPNRSPLSGVVLAIQYQLSGRRSKESADRGGENVHRPVDWAIHWHDDVGVDS